MMLILVTYDVCTETKEGKSRLRRVAKKCVAHGQRVQNSVFECYLDWEIFIKLQSELKEIINPNQDSLRFYNLGNSYDKKTIHLGKAPSLSLNDDLII